MIRVCSISVHIIIVGTKTKNIFYQSTHYQSRIIKNDNMSRWLSEENPESAALNTLMM